MFHINLSLAVQKARYLWSFEPLSCVDRKPQERYCHRPTVDQTRPIHARRREILPLHSRETKDGNNQQYPRKCNYSTSTRESTEVPWSCTEPFTDKNDAETYGNHKGNILRQCANGENCPDRDGSRKDQSVEEDPGEAVDPN